MTNLKILAAALGLVLAAGTIGDVSAKTMSSNIGSTNAVAKTAPAATHRVTGKASTGKLASSKHHRIHVAHRGTKSATLARHLTTREKIAHRRGLTHVAKAGSKGHMTIVR